MSKIENEIQLITGSSAITACSYDQKNQELTVYYRKGGETIYSSVPEITFKNFLKADSQGEYFNRYIRSNYPHN